MSRSFYIGHGWAFLDEGAQNAWDCRRLVHIHSFEPGRYPELFDNVKPHPDGQWWGV